MQGQPEGITNISSGISHRIDDFYPRACSRIVYPLTPAVPAQMEAAAVIFRQLPFAGLVTRSRTIHVVVRQPGTREGLGSQQFDRLECHALFFSGRITVWTHWCRYFLLSRLRLDRVAVGLLHRRAAWPREQERSLDGIPAASACLGNSLRHSLGRTHFRPTR